MITFCQVKKRERELIEKRIAEYLANGGEIQVLAPNARRVFEPAEHFKVETEAQRENKKWKR